MQIAMISGVRGQDGSLLSRLLLEQGGWKVVGFARHTQNPDLSNIKDLLNHDDFILEDGDLTDLGSITRLVTKYKPDRFYHLGAASFVHTSWDEPISVFNVNAIGTLNCLEALRHCSPKTKFLFASTSETVGNSPEPIQNEKTPHTPHSPYAVAKAAGEHLCHVYRFSYGMFTCFTRCYNHESRFRGKNFVTRKITDWIGHAWNVVDKNINRLTGNKLGFISTKEAFERALDEGLISPLKLGNLNSARDWVAAEDCVRAMTMVLDQDKPDDFVISSGRMHTIHDLLSVAFKTIGIDDYKPFIGTDPKFCRPDDVITLCGDYSKAEKILGWTPIIAFDDMIATMVKHDIELHKNDF